MIPSRESFLKPFIAKVSGEEVITKENVLEILKTYAETIIDLCTEFGYRDFNERQAERVKKLIH